MKTVIAAIVLISGILSWSLAEAAGDAAAGEAVYNHVCKMCHTTGMMGAPKLGDKAAWSPRIEQGAAKLTEHAIKGIRKMPARGTCKSCSDEDLANAVAYMMSKAK